MSQLLNEPIGRIGLFGGAFDPPHWGHLRTASAAADELSLDQLAFLPALNPPHKRSQQLTSYELRRRMLELCLPYDRRFRLCLVESEFSVPGTTLETILKLRELGFSEDRCHLIWLMGADALLDFGNWHEPEQLIAEIEIAVLPRPGFDVATAKPNFLPGIRLLTTPRCDLAAQEVRAGKRSLKDSVPEEVEQMIRQQCLYGYRLETAPNSAK